MSRQFRVTTSWDDGHPCDLRLADILSRHGIPATFFVPRFNSGHREVVGIEGIKQLAASFEVGAHTLNHVDLSAVPPLVAEREISGSKSFLEDALGREVTGFCYPRGKCSPQIASQVKQAGFRYARTVRNFHREPGDDPFILPTTMQFFPHRKSVYLRNFAIPPRRVAVETLMVAMSTEDLVERGRRMFAHCRATGTMFHLWGHSWELEEHDLWRDLEDLFSFLRSACDPGDFVSNSAMAEHVSRFERGVPRGGR